MEQNTKWTADMTMKLIRTRHSKNVADKFSEAAKKPWKIKLCWQFLGNCFEPAISAKSVKNKYNHLLMHYRKILAESKRTDGVQNPTWRYWRLFHSTFPFWVDTPRTITDDELEAEDSEDTETNPSQEDDEMSERNAYMDVKMRAYEAITRSLESSNRETANISSLEKAITRLDSTLEKGMTSIQDKLNTLIDIVQMSLREHKGKESREGKGRE